MPVRFFSFFYLTEAGSKRRVTYMTKTLTVRYDNSSSRTSEKVSLGGRVTDGPANSLGRYSELDIPNNSVEGVVCSLAGWAATPFDTRTMARGAERNKAAATWLRAVADKLETQPF